MDKKASSAVDRVTSNENPLQVSGVEIVGKRALCERLGWSRPALDRRIRADKGFPVLRCGNRGTPWQFDIDAVLAHLANSPAPRRDPASLLPSTCRTPDTPSREALCDVRREIARMQALRRVIEGLMAELGGVIDRISTALGYAGMSSEVGPEVSGHGDGH